MPIDIDGIGKVYTADEVAAELGVKSRTIKDYIKKDKLKGCRIGRQIMIHEESLKSFLKGETTGIKQED